MILSIISSVFVRYYNLFLLFSEISLDHRLIVSTPSLSPFGQTMLLQHFKQLSANHFMQHYSFHKFGPVNIYFNNFYCIIALNDIGVLYEPL